MADWSLITQKTFTSFRIFVDKFPFITDAPVYQLEDEFVHSQVEELPQHIAEEEEADKPCDIIALFYHIFNGLLFKTKIYHL